MEKEDDMAHTWYTCDINRTGPGWGNIYIALSDRAGSFTNQWFKARDDQKKEMLDTALMAMSHNFKVQVAIDHATAPYGTILALYPSNM